jgi:hypothetical protein
MTFVILLLAFAAQCFAGGGPDPRAVARWNAGWRYPQAGWIVVHIEGEPYERGLQHGHLLAPEIAGYVRALAEYYGPQAPAPAWDQTRRLVNALFLKCRSGPIHNRPAGCHPAPHLAVGQLVKLRRIVNPPQRSKLQRRTGFEPARAATLVIRALERCNSLQGIKATSCDFLFLF